MKDKKPPTIEWEGEWKSSLSYRNYILGLKPSQKISFWDNQAMTQKEIGKIRRTNDRMLDIFGGFCIGVFLSWVVTVLMLI